MNQITIGDDTQAILDRVLPSMMADFNMTREEMLEQLVGIGICTVLREKAEKLETLVKARHAIPKLKAEVHVTTEELDAIFYAARDGDTASQVIVSDFKRFGRSIEK